ncbi:MAG: DUF1345 domain-containing protein [Alsobacter sp.]
MTDLPAAPRRRHPLHVRLGRAARARPIFVAACLAALVTLALLPETSRTVARSLVAWDAFVVVYIVGACAMMALTPDAEMIQNRAEGLDYGSGAVLVVTIGGAVASLFAIAVELAAAKVGGHTRASPIALSIATVALSWVFTHLVFALHYAHEFYGPDGSPSDDDTRQGLKFPGTAEPNYVEFVYFAFVIGCACATADVNITSRRMRWVAMAHGVVAFVFNTAIVALSINIAAGLLSAA